MKDGDGEWDPKVVADFVAESEGRWVEELTPVSNSEDEPRRSPRNLRYSRRRKTTWWTISALSSLRGTTSTHSQTMTFASSQSKQECQNITPGIEDAKWSCGVSQKSELGS